MKDIIKARGEVALVGIHPSGKREIIYRSTNRITNEGARLFAALGAQATPVSAFFATGAYDVRMALSNSATVNAQALNDQDAGGSGGFTAAAPFLAGSLAAMDSGYPKIADDDIDNPFADLANKLSYRVTYAAAQSFATDPLYGVCIVSPDFTTGSYASGSKILSGAFFAANQTQITWPSIEIKVFVVHSILSP
jgi:hypothetical protein